MTRQSRAKPAEPTEDLTEQLLAAHGEVLGGPELMRCLGYRSASSFARALAQHQVPVATFMLPGRRGRHARTRDIARWLNALGGAAESTSREDAAMR